jgi:acyl-CoA thioester hydrolase
VSASLEPLRTRLQLRWADTDGYGHVNNVVWLRYLEETRIRLFGLPDRPATADPDAPPVFGEIVGSDCFTVTAANRVEYRKELIYRGQSVCAEAWLSRIGSSSVDMSFQVTDDAGAQTYLVAESTQAFRLIATRQARRFSATEAAALGMYLAPANQFR